MVALDSFRADIAMSHKLFWDCRHRGNRIGTWYLGRVFEIVSSAYICEIVDYILASPMLQQDGVSKVFLSLIFPLMFNPDNLPVFSTPDELAILGLQFGPQVQTILQNFPDGSFAIVEYGEEDVPLALCHPNFVEELSKAFHGGVCLKYEHGEDYKAARRAWLARKPPVPIDPSTGQPYTLDEDGYIVEAESGNGCCDTEERPLGQADGQAEGPADEQAGGTRGTGEAR